MELQLINSDKKIKLPTGVFDREFKESLIHQVVTAYLAAKRSGTHQQKTRAEVRGGGIKPWRQKGTGRARAGTIRSPLWRKGGVIFAARPRDYSQKVNKKAYRTAMSSILSELIRQDRLVAIDKFELDTAKTKSLIKMLNDLKLGQDVLIITDSVEGNLELAARNLPYVEIRKPLDIDPVALVNADKVLVTKDALKRIEEWLE